MNKQELINRMCDLSTLKRKEANEFLSLLESILTEEIREGNHICLQNFGTFVLWHQSARPGRNPKTGTPCLIPPRLSVKFKPGKRVTNSLNQKSRK